MTKPAFITFTGVDNFTNLHELGRLSRAYPIEWGVLIGGNPDKGRYPELSKIHEVSSYSLANPTFMCSLHLCGIFAKQFQEHGYVTPEIDIGGFQRFQVNAINYNIEDLGVYANKFAKGVVFQHRTNTFPTELPPNVFPLHDKSGGKGLVPKSRPEPTNNLVGYAGGIGPDNVEEILDSIGPGKFWIDMETSLRTDDRFDLSICERICKTVFDT